MLRNRELRIAVWISLAVMLITACLLLQISSIAMLIALFSQGLLLGIYLLLSQYRYTQLKTLSMYLQQVYQGDGALDIPQYKEGELSILHSDLYKITRTLQLQKESLQKDKLFLADSLSDISHQLKTPLTSMMVMSELLKDEHLSKEQHDQFVDALRQQLKRIEWLVSTLLKLSRIDAQVLQFHPQQISVYQLSLIHI